MKQILVLLTTLLFFTGCSGLQKRKPELSVSVQSFRMLPGNGVVPKFEIGLHVVNTSPVDVDIKGVVYRVYLQNRKILTGATNDLPKIPAYGEADIVVAGTPDLFETIGFFRDLMGRPGKNLEYRVDVDIDAGSWIPMIHTEKKGTISLGKGTTLP